jgi:hypothetical protein
VFTFQTIVQLAIVTLFARLISHQPAVLFSQNEPATNNQSAVLFSQNKSAPAISHQPTEQALQKMTVTFGYSVTLKRRAKEL